MNSEAARLVAEGVEELAVVARRLGQLAADAEQAAGMAAEALALRAASEAANQARVALLREGSRGNSQEALW